MASTGKKATPSTLPAMLRSLSKGGIAGQKRKREALEKMSREELGREAKKHGVTLLQKSDVGATRAELFQSYELGIPAEVGWTKVGVK